MERITLLRKRFDSLKRAHVRFKNEVDLLKRFNDPQHEFYHTFRNSAIKTFEFTVDPFWKFLKIYILQVHGVDIDQPGPRIVYRIAMDQGLIKEDELPVFMNMVEDRNQAAHDYDELAIDEIKNKLPQYCTTIGNVLMRIDMQLKEN